MDKRHIYKAGESHATRGKMKGRVILNKNEKSSFVWPTKDRG
jgi:hypothetical protein